MEDWFKILPEAILYLASGYAFICGFYLWIDKRFDFFSDISFSIMLVIGFVCTNIFRVFKIESMIKNENLRNVVIVVICLFVGSIIAFLRNSLGERVSKFIIKSGRRKTTSQLFWYDILDKKDKPVWVRLKNRDKNCILEGVLLSIDEAEDNPYILLGYCKRYDLQGNIIEDAYSEDDTVQCVVRVDSFEEIELIYDENSDKKVKLDIR